MNAFRITTLTRIARPTRLPTVSRTQTCRLFGSTAVRGASEDGESFIATFKNTPMFNRFAEHPDALAALSKVAEFLKKNEIDMTGPPSSMTLFKLATNSEFRALTKNALEEMKKAGIEIKPEQAMEMFSQPPGPPKGSQ